MRRPASRILLLTASLVTFAFAACSDRNPATAPGDPRPAPPSSLVALNCTVSVRAGTLACAPRGPGGEVSAAILGTRAWTCGSSPPG